MLEETRFRVRKKSINLDEGDYYNIVTFANEYLNAKLKRINARFIARVHKPEGRACIIIALTNGKKVLEAKELHSVFLLSTHEPFKKVLDRELITLFRRIKKKYPYIATAV